MKTKNILFITMAIIFLSSCSKEPSREEINRALTDSLKNEFSAITQQKIFGLPVGSIAGIEDIQINSIEKINCKSSESNVALCEVAVDVTIKSSQGSLLDLFGGTGRKKTVNFYRFVKTSNGWIVANSQ